LLAGLLLEYVDGYSITEAGETLLSADQIADLELRAHTALAEVLQGVIG
jgi:hypothetical protein